MIGQSGGLSIDDFLPLLSGHFEVVLLDRFPARLLLVGHVIDLSFTEIGILAEGFQGYHALTDSLGGQADGAGEVLFGHECIFLFCSWKRGSERRFSNDLHEFIALTDPPFRLGFDALFLGGRELLGFAKGNETQAC